MIKRVRNNAPAYCGDIKDTMKYFNLGAATTRKIAKEAGAVMKIGRLTRYNYEKIENYINGNLVEDANN